MTYIPTSPHHTALPSELGRDLELQIKLLEERFSRFQTEITYYPILVLPTVSSDLSTPAGEAGSTKYDPLYLEPVDPDMTTIQPAHGTEYESVGNEQYGTGETLYAQLRQDPEDLALKHYGYDKVRELLVVIPTSILDTAGITCRPRDKFVWDGNTYEVHEARRGGRWKNTNVFLTVGLNCSTKRTGS